MNSLKNQRGFGAVEIIILIVVLALAGIGGWYVWQAQNRASEQQPSANAPSTSNDNPVVVDPYEGWKLYCDDVNKACFKYPADWTIQTESISSVTSATATNANGTLRASYNSNDFRDGHTQQLYLAHIGDISVADARLKVLGSFISSSTNSLPDYRLIDAALLTTFPLEVGKQGNFPDTARFKNLDGINASFSVKPIGKVFTDDQAKQWFDTADAKQGLLIIKSFYFKQ